MSKDPVFPSYLSTHAVDLLKILLSKNPEKRVLCVKTLKSHPFFSEIDWKLLKDKKIKPPYIPNLKNDADMSHFDTADLQLEVNSFEEEQKENCSGKNQAEDPYKDFDGFTFDGNSVNLGQS